MVVSRSLLSTKQVLVVVIDDFLEENEIIITAVLENRKKVAGCCCQDVRLLMMVTSYDGCEYRIWLLLPLAATYGRGVMLPVLWAREKGTIIMRLANNNSS
jgi:hypothetical protein